MLGRQLYSDAVVHLDDGSSVPIHRFVFAAWGINSVAFKVSGLLYCALPMQWTHESRWWVGGNEGLIDARMLTNDLVYLVLSGLWVIPLSVLSDRLSRYSVGIDINMCAVPTLKLSREFILWLRWPIILAFHLSICRVPLSISVLTIAGPILASSIVRKAWGVDSARDRADFHLRGWCLESRWCHLNDPRVPLRTVFGSKSAHHNF